MPPKFSVVIPAYNQAQFLAETIQSVLDQTLQDFEIIVVNDASTDDTNAVIAQFDDPRLRSIIHPQNKGLPAARNSGMNASRGDYIALLDADDIFHPQKLEQHNLFLTAHPEVSVTYNGRLELHHSSRLVREIYRPPLQVGLKDFILGFPFSPSDMVVRRTASAQVNHFDANYVCGGEDLDYPCRLALARHHFASVDRVLNSRRYHSERPRKKLRCRIGDYTKAIESVKMNPHCPAEVIPTLKTGLANHYSEVAWTALSQNEIDLGVEILQEITQLDPSMVSGLPPRLANLFFVRSLKDHTKDHQESLRRVFSYLPAEIAMTDGLCDWYISRGYLLKGALAVLWGQEDAGRKHFLQAAQLKARMDRPYLEWLSSHVINYFDEFGPSQGRAAIQRLAPHLREAGGNSNVRSLQSLVAINRAFQSFRKQDYQTTRGEVIRALSNNPAYFLNRGVLSIAVRSFLRAHG
jgi:glycosyltransferase involved in cell wall biosynthesis